MEIRKGTLKDLEAIAAVEACFPAAEAATARSLPGGFSSTTWLLWEGEGLAPLWTAFAPTGRT